MKYVTLNNGVKMPQLGYGVYQVTIRAIGISNFYTDRMVDFASFNRIRPMVNQVEIHPHNQQTEAKAWHLLYIFSMPLTKYFGLLKYCKLRYIFELHF